MKDEKGHHTTRQSFIQASICAQKRKRILTDFTSCGGGVITHTTVRGAALRAQARTTSGRTRTRTSHLSLPTKQRSLPLTASSNSTTFGRTTCYLIQYRESDEAAHSFSFFSFLHHQSSKNLVNGGGSVRFECQRRHFCPYCHSSIRRIKGQ